MKSVPDLLGDSDRQLASAVDEGHLCDVCVGLPREGSSGSSGEHTKDDLGAL